MRKVRPEIVLIADKTDSWCGPVAQLIGDRIDSLIVNPNASVPATVDVSNVKIMVASPSDAKTFAPNFPNLVWIQSTWAGVDALTGHISPSVSVTPLKGVFGQAMSEFVLGWILSIERNIIERAQATTWNPATERGVKGKTMGILGTGSIGRAIAASVQPLGIKCRGMNSSGAPTPGFIECYESGNSHFFQDLDYCVVVLPKTEATNRILGEREFKLMNDDAIVINVGRGNAIDDEALLQALDRRQIRSAVLDVFAIEPLPNRHPMWEHPRVHITSHTAAPTSTDLVALAMSDNFERYLANQALHGLYDESKGY